MHCSICLFCISSLDKVFSGCFRQVFFIWETKKLVTGHVRQVVILYSNDCTGLCLGRLGICCLRQVVILQRWLFEQVWL